MKKIEYSMQDMFRKMGELAARKGRTYHTLSIVMSQHASEAQAKIRFTCYIDGYGNTDGSTFEEAYEKMEEKMFPLVQTSDVTIDVTI